MASDSSEEVEKHAVNLLRDCGVSRAPTPLKLVLAHRKLALQPFSLPRNTKSAVADSIRAFIDMPERKVFVSEQLHEKQQRFASFHEIGHDTLPWHRELLYECSELDLSPAARRKFDVEANAFAAACIYQGNGFTEEALDYRFGMRAVMALADRYAVSFESASRRYVERHEKACALAVCAPIKSDDPGKPAFELKYAVRSADFPVWLEPGSVLSEDHSISQICHRRSNSPAGENVILTDGRSTEFKCKAHVLFNGYKALILLKPRRFKGVGQSTPLL